MFIKKLDRRIWDALFIIGFAAMLAMLIWKAPFGFQGKDEPFYLSIPLRMMQGDALIADEWHVAQLSGLLLYPAMRIYAALGGGTEGMLLSFRYIYIGAQCLAAIYIYARLREYNAPGAIFAGLTFMCFAPHNLMALSYNTMGFQLMTGAGLTMACGRHRGAASIASGLMFAGAVLCCPYLMALYLIYTLCVLCGKLFEKEENSAKGVLKIREWALFTLGAAILAAVLMISVATRAGIGAAIAALPEILNDPAHPQSGLVDKFAEALEMLVLSHPNVKWIFPALAALLIIIYFDKNRHGHRAIYLILAAGLSLAYAKWDILHADNNFIMLPINILGMVGYILTREKNTRLFTYVFIPGCIYSVCIHFASNTHLYAITAACCVTCTASLALLGGLIFELLGEGRARGLSLAAAGIIAACMIGLLGTEGIMRIKYCYGDMTETQYMEAEIDCGVAKGLKITPEYADEKYYAILEYTRPVRQAQGENVLYVCMETWPYLMDSKDNAGYSAWLSLDHAENAAGRLKTYWALHPDKRPDAVYIDKGLDGAEMLLAAIRDDTLHLTENAGGYILLK